MASSPDTKIVAKDTPSSTASVLKPVDLPKVYSWYNHPKKSITEVLLGLLFFWLVPCYKVVMIAEGKSCRNKDPKKHQEALAAANEPVRNAGIFAALRSVHDWLLSKIAKDTGCTWVNSRVKIRRRAQVLKEWGFDDEHTRIQTTHERSEIGVQVFLPASLLPKDKQPDNPKSELVVQCDRMEPSDLPLDIPVIVNFHAGGFTVGDDRMVEGIQVVAAAVESVTTSSQQQEEPIDPKAQTVPRFVYMSVDYCLAPEHPFPAATVEALSVISYLLETMNQATPIHIIGVSAGGNLATVATMECHRRFPGRVKCAFIGCPMLNPACDTMSFYQNPTMYSNPPSGWLRWCWRVYLGLPETRSHEPESDEMPDMDKVLAHVSNRATWEESKWRKTTMERLINPIADLPDSLDEAKAPKIIVTTNRADPLHADGVALVAGLKARKAKVSYHDHDGIHWGGTIGDIAIFRKLGGEWAGAMQF